MPNAEGEYILQLTATNTCNDVSVYQWPIVIIPGPDSPSPFTYAPDGTPIFTSKLASENNNNISESNSNVIISNDEVGIFIQGINVSRCSVKVIDILGRTLYSEQNINIENKFYLDKINAENQWILVNVEFEGKSITKKIFLNR
jgi:hypothetical protein